MSAASDLLMPKLGLTMQEGLLAEWHVVPGDRVKGGQILFVVETDKLATEVEATGPGEILELVAQAGETLPVGAVVGRWTGAAATTPDEIAVVEPQAVPAPAPALAEAAVAAAAARPPGGHRVIATPLARRAARLKGIDLAALTGRGPRGRIKLADVEAESSTPAARPEAPREPGTTTHQAATPLQQTVARRLREAKREIPHFYLAAEADVAALLALRGELNIDAGHSRLSLNHFVLAAVARVWATHPEANRIWHDDGFALLPSVDVGLAVDTPRGLFAPVVPDAAALRFDELAQSADALAARAKAGRLEAADLQGGAVTVSNVGLSRVTYLTPIINPGQSAILGVGAVRQVFRPDDHGQPVLRHELGLVLACDHRVFNGVLAAQLLGDIIGYLEAPLRLLRGTPTKGQRS